MPVLNECQILAETYRRVKNVLSALTVDHEILFVDDGSTDGSTDMLHALTRRDSAVRVMVLSRNFGQQAAYTAGLEYARGRAVILLDADLQDPPEVIPEMVREWRNGYQVVYGHRAERKGETWFKRASAAIFYRLLRLVAGAHAPVDVGDFKLLDRKVVEALNRCPERSRFLRGLVSWIGFRQKAVEYVRDARSAGETKYSLWKMARLSIDAFLASSRAPLRVGTWFGAVIALIAFIKRLVEPNDDRSRSPVRESTVFLLHGLGMLCQGLLGEYLSQVYLETQGRPLYIVSQVWGDASPQRYHHRRRSPNPPRPK
ncbi:MAG: glycosyltransferase family 2 protein [Candidatus Riflebacteria bacterium]|nr:glycosyltransferase family 2 protein [Candidatus Riflebacteria bacterium]